VDYEERGASFRNRLTFLREQSSTGLMMISVFGTTTTKRCRQTGVLELLRTSLDFKKQSLSKSMSSLEDAHIFDIAILSLVRILPAALTTVCACTRS
jgi:hypothetical protein